VSNAAWQVGAVSLGILIASYLSFGSQLSPPAFAGAAVALVALAALLVFLARAARRRRDEAFAKVAAANGWAHATDVRDGPMEDVAACKPYSDGHGASALQMLSGMREGARFHLLDGVYTTGSGKSRQTHHTATVALGMPFELLLTIERETFGHKVADAFGGEDIDVESDEFSRRFWVKSSDRRRAYDVLHPRAVEFLLALPGTWTWHWNGPVLVMSRPGRLQPQDCLPLLQQAWQFRALLPRHLLGQPAVPPQWSRPPAAGPQPSGR
jgi:hypothetical protein